jgi:hypothetical protein
MAQTGMGGTGMGEEKMGFRGRHVWLVAASAAWLGLLGSTAAARPSRPLEVTVPVPAGQIMVEALKEHVGAGDAAILAHVPAKTRFARFALQYEIDGRWREVTFVPAKAVAVGADTLRSGVTQIWKAAIPHQGRGAHVPYYLRFELKEAGAMQVPAAAPAEHFLLTFKGKPSRPLLFAHVLFMMGGLIPLGIAFAAAWIYLLRGRSLVWLRRPVLIGFVSLLIGGVALGIPVEHQVFGTYWGGWPFGRDVTDTKTGLLLALWLVLILARGREILVRRMARRPPGDRAWAVAVIVLALLTVALYLIPHENVKF